MRVATDVNCERGGLERLFDLWAVDRVGGPPWRVSRNERWGLNNEKNEPHRGAMRTRCRAVKL